MEPGNVAVTPVAEADSVSLRGALGKALVLVAVAVLAGALVYWIARGRMTTSASGTAATETGTVARERPEKQPSDRGSTQLPPIGSIEAPISAEQRERDALEHRREPFYLELRQAGAGGLAAARPSDEDPATLDLYSTTDSPGATAALLNLALRTNAYYYGFRHIRFYLPNSPQSVEHYRLDAEASADRNQNWQTFQK